MRGLENMMDSATNLLEETISVLSENDKTVADVLWCGTKEYYFKWHDYKRIADIYYDAGYGSSKIAYDLLVVGDGWWLERGGYDGLEWWEFKTAITKPKIEKVPSQLDVVVWDTLAELNNWQDEENTLTNLFD